MATRSTNTMSEVLISILEMLASAKVMPDADVAWIINLETQIADKAREPYKSMQGGQQPAPEAAPGGMPGGGAPDLSSLLGGMGPGMPGPPNNPGMGGPPMPQMPAPMTGARPGGGGGMSASGMGEVSRIMGAGPPRGGRYG
jgi:hypothetical protein